jgi:hypothetical protein
MAGDSKRDLQEGFEKRGQKTIKTTPAPERSTTAEPPPPPPKTDSPPSDS